MTYSQIYPNLSTWSDTDGTPLNNGYVYIGTAGLDPVTNPITIYYDIALSLQAPNPLRTTNGYLSNNGSPTGVYISNAITQYSLVVKNNAGTTIFSQLNVDAISAFLGYATAPTGKAYFNNSTPSNEQDYIYQSGTNYQFFANGALGNGQFSTITAETATISTSATLAGVSLRDASILNAGTLSQDRLPSEITNAINFTNATFNSNTAVGQQKATFTPTFNGAPTATTLEGRYVRLGDKVDAFITISGTDAQRAGLSSGTLLEIGDIPFITEFTNQTGQFVSVFEEFGTYFQENNMPSQAGYLDKDADVLYLWNHGEAGRALKTYGDWSSGDFTFNIILSYILN